MKTPQFLKTLWRKIEKRRKEQREDEHHYTEDSQPPPSDIPFHDYGTARHHSITDEIQYRTNERYYWQKQLHLAEELNQLTNALNRTTRLATSFAGIAALAGFASIFILWWTLTETTENDRIDQRAWVGVSYFHDSAKIRIVAESPIQFAIFVKNSGKTPALNIKMRMQSSVIKGKRFTPQYANSLTQQEHRVGVLFPGWEGIEDAYPSELTQLNQGEIDQLGKDGSVLYFYGTVEYDDVFTPATSHCTTFCFIYDPVRQIDQTCETYNKVNDTRCENIQ